MKKIIMIYTSATGSTEAIAEALTTAFNKNTEIELTVEDSFNASPEELHKYDAILIGTYTWEGGVIPDEFMYFYEELDQEDLSGKIAAVFGSGDSYYKNTYGAALKLFSEKLAALGAKIALPIFLVDLYPEDEDLIAAQQFADQFCQEILQ